MSQVGAAEVEARPVTSQRRVGELRVSDDASEHTGHERELEVAGKLQRLTGEVAVLARAVLLEHVLRRDRGDERRRPLPVLRGLRVDVDRCRLAETQTTPGDVEVRLARVPVVTPDEQGRARRHRHDRGHRVVQEAGLLRAADVDHRGVLLGGVPLIVWLPQHHLARPRSGCRTGRGTPGGRRRGRRRRHHQARDGHERRDGRRENPSRAHQEGSKRLIDGSWTPRTGSIAGSPLLSRIGV